MKYYPLDEKTAVCSHMGNSMMPYRSDEQMYRQEVDEVYTLAEEAAKRDHDRADEAHVPEHSDKWMFKFSRS